MEYEKAQVRTIVAYFQELRAGKTKYQISQRDFLSSWSIYGKKIFNALCHSHRNVLDLLVTDRNSDLAEFVYSVKPHPQMPLLSVHRAQVNLYGSADAKPDDMHAGARKFRPAPVEEGQLVTNSSLSLHLKSLYPAL
ncbi:hypothetical protein V1515DRAFT_582323 [Lipomyces mesembrius]